MADLSELLAKLHNIGPNAVSCTNYGANRAEVTVHCVSLVGAHAVMDGILALAHAIPDELAALRARVAELEGERARLRHIMLGLTIIEKMEARQDADAEEARIRADERQRIAAAIEDAHQPGTYPHKMAQAIRANATPSGHPLDAGWHERAVAAARADERAWTERDVVARFRAIAEDESVEDIARAVERGDYPKLPRGG